MNRDTLPRVTRGDNISFEAERWSWRFGARAAAPCERRGSGLRLAGWQLIQTDREKAFRGSLFDRFTGLDRATLGGRVDLAFLLHVEQRRPGSRAVEGDASLHDDLPGVLIDLRVEERERAHQITLRRECVLERR